MQVKCPGNLGGCRHPHCHRPYSAFIEHGVADVGGKGENTELLILRFLCLEDLPDSPIHFFRLSFLV